MRHRESDLSRNKLAQRAYSLLSSDRIAVNREIQLRVVREFGLPDSAIEILQGSVDYAPHRQDMCLPLSGAYCLVPHHGRRLFQFPPRAIHRVYNMEDRQSPSASPALVRSCNHLEVSCVLGCIVCMNIFFRTLIMVLFTCLILWHETQAVLKKGILLKKATLSTTLQFLHSTVTSTTRSVNNSFVEHNTTSR